MVAVSRRTTGNRLLDSLPSHERSALLESSSLVELEVGETTYHAGSSMRYVYFPVDCVISLLVRMTDGSEAELVSIGREAGHGAARAVVGINKASYHSVCSISGRAYRIPVREFRELAVPGTGSYQRAMQYHTCLTGAIAYCAGCIRFHVPVQRTACWLLLGQDHTGRDSFELTHAFIGRLLGIHRPAASLAAARLQESGAITYSRGEVVLRDRKRLEGMACECYRKVRAEYRRLYR